MPQRLVLFGPGYTGSRIAARLEAEGWEVARVGRNAERGAVLEALGRATHVLSTVPPLLPGTGRGTARAASGGGAVLDESPGERPLHQPMAGPPPRRVPTKVLLSWEPGAGEELDPILSAYGPAIAAARWIGYLSSTGVYGDAGGGWVDESAPLNGRRGGRIAAERAWLALGARALRLPGIYGPDRSAIDRLAAGTAHLVDLPGQVFSRVHVDDIVAGVIAAIARGDPGAYNLADDLPAPQNDVVAAACAMTGLPLPPMIAVEALSPAARGFYGENRRAANGRAKRLLGWRPLHPDYRAGLRALIATSSPATVSAAPDAATAVQR